VDKNSSVSQYLVLSSLTQWVYSMIIQYAMYVVFAKHQNKVVIQILSLTLPFQALSFLSYTLRAVVVYSSAEK
jgi:hypothetical protein